MNEVTERDTPTQERTFHGKDVAPVEHYLLGGTDVYRDEGLVNFAWLMKKAKNGDLDPELFKVPNADASLPEALSQVNELRREQRLKKSGLMPFTELGVVQALGRRGLKFGFVLGDVREDGKVDSKWQIILIDGKDNEVERESLLRKFTLSEEAKEGLDLKFEDGKLFIALK